MASLQSRVIDKIRDLGVKESSKLFGVSIGTASNWLSGKSTPSINAAEIVLSLEPSPPEISDDPETEPFHQWEGKKVIILLPVYQTINPHTHFTLFANYAKYGPEKLGMDMKTRTVIHESRNILIHKMMDNPDAKTGIMVDGDVILPCGIPGLLNTRYNAKLPANLASQVAISRLMSHGVDKGIVGGLYFGRGPNGRAQCESGFASTADNTKHHNLGYSGLKAEGWVATGCLKIERWVIEKMKEAIDGGKWPECKPKKEGDWYGYFNPLRVGVGEDVSFGRRASEIGIQSYVDTSLVCGHAEGNYIYWHHNSRGNL